MSKFVLTANQYAMTSWVLYLFIFFMLSLSIPVCILHVQHNSVRIRHVSGVQMPSAAKATVLSGTNTVHICPCTQQVLILLMSVSLSA